MVEARGIEPLSENAVAKLSPSAVSCYYSPSPASNDKGRDRVASYLHLALKALGKRRSLQL